MNKLPKEVREPMKTNKSRKFGSYVFVVLAITYAIMLIGFIVFAFNQ